MLELWRDRTHPVETFQHHADRSAPALNRRTLVTGNVSLCGLCRATKVSFFPAARYHHSTFSPDAVEVNMVYGRASCSTLTYGDFTVGAWLPRVAPRSSWT